MNLPAIAVETGLEVSYSPTFAILMRPTSKDEYRTICAVDQYPIAAVLIQTLQLAFSTDNPNNAKASWAIAEINNDE